MNIYERLKDVSQIQAIGYGLWAIGINVSHPIMSIGQGLILLAAAIHILYYKQPLQKPTLFVYLIGGIFLLTLCSGIYTEHIPVWVVELRIKFPLLFLPLAALQLPYPTPKQRKTVAFLFVLSACIVSILSLTSYIIQYDHAWDVMQSHINKNGTIDIVSHVHHIYFGLFLAFGSIFAFFESRKNEVFYFAHENKLLLALSLTNVVLLHLLTSRTGYVAFYLGVFVGILGLIFQQKKYLIGMVLFISAVSIPLLAYQFLPTFKTRVIITIWDAREFLVHHKLPDGSIAKRLYAWEQMKGILSEHPLMGVGAGDLKEELYNRSVAHLGDYQLAPDMNASRLLDSPHNQYMELAGKVGILGLCCLLGALLYPLFHRPSLLLLIFTVQIAATMMSESLLERQWGVAFWTGILGLLYLKKNHSE